MPMSTSPPTTSLLREGLWHQNPALVQLLGLCPLLAVSTSAINGVGLGLATLFVLLGSSLTVSVSRQWVAREIRLPVFVLIIATLVTMVELLLRAYTPGLFRALGIFVPLIVTNCLILGRAEAFASRVAWRPAALDALAMGLGFMGVLVVLGALRELLGAGTLLGDAERLFGPGARGLSVHLLPGDAGFLLALLPPGAFIGLGLLIALRNHYRMRRAGTAPASTASGPDRPGTAPA